MKKKNSDKKKMSPAFRVLRWILGIVGVIAALAVIALAVLTIGEYRPADNESLEISGSAESTPKYKVTVLSFNIGYCGLDSSQDFFMDGGKNVRPDSRDEVEANLAGIEEIIAANPADAVFIQEADRNSDRSFHIDEAAALSSARGGESAFAFNFNALFVPYPMPMIGHVESGLLTMTDFSVDSAQRVALPVPFKWPLSTCNLKRCLLVTRVPCGDKELVFVNLHLEAYDNGEGKAAQTKVLMDFLESEYAKGNYVIAGGDFNQSFPDIDQNPVTDPSLWQPGTLDYDMLPDGWRFAVDRFTPSCRLDNVPYTGQDGAQLYFIDGFILSPNVNLNNIKTIDANFQYSDHNPVLLTAELEK